MSTNRAQPPSGRGARSIPFAPRSGSSWLCLVALFAAGVTGAACQSKAADLREWKPTDHAEEPQDPSKTGQSTGEAQATPPGLDEVTLVSWSNNCVKCHGKMGRGDGPQAAMFRPRDLSDPKWQAAVSDPQIADVIHHGKGAMPPFALPDATIDSLVKLIRLMNADRLKAMNDQPGAAASGAPAASGAVKPSAPAHAASGSNAQ